MGGCRTEPVDDLGVMRNIIEKHLLTGGRLARGDLQAPRLSDAEYAAAFEKVRQSCGSELMALLRAPGYVNVVLNFDRFIRNYLNEDGSTMTRGADFAPGSLTVEQYIEAANRFTTAMSPELKTLMNTSNPSILLRLDRMIRGGQ